MKKIILILLVCAMITSVLASCNSADDAYYTQPDAEIPTTNEEEKPIDYTKGEDTPDKLVTDDMEFTADLFLVAGKMSYLPDFDIKVVDGQLYICDILFDTVMYAQNVDVKYDANYDCFMPEVSIEYNGIISGTEEQIEVLKLMEKIARQENCYLLQSSINNHLADYIAAYYIEGVCYFVSFNMKNIAFRINCVQIESGK